MKRYLYNDLLAWKKSSKRRPLVLFAARQVGKTWLLKEFGEKSTDVFEELNILER